MISVAIAGDRSPRMRLLLQVHDELLVEAEAKDRQHAADEVKRLMEGAVPQLGVPFPVRISVSDKSWATCC